MARFAVGQMVKLVSHDPDDYMPPIGAIGTVLRGADAVGDYAVMFHGFPCGTLDGNDWEVPGCQLAPLTDSPEEPGRWTWERLVDAVDREMWMMPK